MDHFLRPGGKPKKYSNIGTPIGLPALYSRAPGVASASWPMPRSRRTTGLVAGRQAVPHDMICLLFVLRFHKMGTPPSQLDVWLRWATVPFNYRDGRAQPRN